MNLCLTIAVWPAALDQGQAQALVVSLAAAATAPRTQAFRMPGVQVEPMPQASWQVRLGDGRGLSQCRDDQRDSRPGSLRSQPEAAPVWEVSSVFAAAAFST